MAQSDIIGWLLITLMLVCAIGVLIALHHIDTYLRNATKEDQIYNRQTHQLYGLYEWVTQECSNHMEIRKRLERQLLDPNQKQDNQSESLVLLVEKYTFTAKELTEIRHRLEIILENR